MLQALAQIGAEATQLFDAGNDAVLFGEGREGDQRQPHVTDVYVLRTDSFVECQ